MSDKPMAWLELNILLHQLLPLEEGPYQLTEITEALKDAYGSRINYNRVNYAFRTLYNNKHLREKVEPLNPGETPLYFKAESAWRICRHVVRGKLPAKVAGLPAQGLPPNIKNSSIIKAK